MTKYLFILIQFLFLTTACLAQHLKPGFDKQEFLELLKIGARTTADGNYYKKLPAPQRSELVYQSNKVGFDNLWQLWRMDNSVGVISIRGTTKTTVSFLANLYAAMVPAKGVLQLEKDVPFNYDLSDNPRAAVHVGFLVAMAYLSRDIVPKIDSAYKAGTKEFIITGHSQGGAITYLLTSYFDQLKKENRLPKDLRFKTCAGAPPKPGNLFYAYDFENLTKDGWSYVVINAVDWVPELPFSIQTLDDMNETNPFLNAKQLIRKQKFPNNLVLRIAYNELSKPAKKAQRKYETWLGKRFGKIVRKNLKELSVPDFYKSNSYVRTGYPIILMPDSAYFVKFPEIKDSIWHNHIHAPYLFLTERLPDNENTNSQQAPSSNLNGKWKLEYIAGLSVSLDSFFQKKIPFLEFNVEKNELTGNTGCNSLSGKLSINGNKINFNAPLALTKMFCPGIGEKLFLERLIWVNTYSVSGNNLMLIKDDMVEMNFVRVE